MDKRYDIGIYYGYPTCCIEAFCFEQKGAPTKEQCIVSKNTGFIPCPNHMQYILKGIITLESLIQYRQHHIPFPNSSKRMKQIHRKQ